MLTMRPSKRRDERLAEDPHEAGQHDPRGAAPGTHHPLHGVRECNVERGAIGEVAMIHHARGNPWLSAQARPAASLRLLITPAIWPSRWPVAAACTSVRRLEPRPDISTTSGAREVGFCIVHDVTAAGDLPRRLPSGGTTELCQGSLDRAPWTGLLDRDPQTGLLDRAPYNLPVKVFRRLPPPDQRRPCALTIGNFDGVHRGHQALVSGLVSEAREHGLLSCVLTFEPHPREFFASAESQPVRIANLRDKLEALASLEVDRVCVAHFNQSLAATSAHDFITDILVDGLHTRRLLIGDDFRFGARRGGNFALLQSSWAPAWAWRSRRCRR